MTPRHTRLDNVRVVNLENDPECTECGCPLSERPIADIVVWNRRMFCDTICRMAFIDDLHPVTAAHRAYGPDHLDLTPPSSPRPPGTPPPTNAQLNKEFHGPSIGREAAVAAVNIIGFIMWIVVISAIAGVIAMIWR